jgi:hypothetical protein
VCLVSQAPLTCFRRLYFPAQSLDLAFLAEGDEERSNHFFRWMARSAALFHLSLASTHRIEKENEREREMLLLLG